MWCLIGVMAALLLAVGDVRAEVPPREPLVYYQLLVLSFLTRATCGSDIQGWPDGLHAIREILKKDLGHTDRELSAIEAKANEMRLGVPCNSEASRDLFEVTMHEPQVALIWFKALTTARNP
jgi:hypothetical protein